MSEAHDQQLFEAALSGVVGYELLVQVGSASSLSPPEVLDSLAVFVAQKYLAGAMSFEDADTIMNACFGVAASEKFWAEHDRTIPPTMYEVYLVFDSGEFCHPGDDEGVNPELKYTRPAIASFLEARKNGA